MPGFIRLLKYVASGIAAVVLTTDISRASLTKPPQSLPQSGTVRIKFVKAGLIVGVGRGSGSLIYRGKTYQLSIGGVDVGSVGITTLQLAGTANNLHNVSDIAGTYSATGSGASIGARNKVATVQNERGVVLKLRGLQMGFQASLGLAGMTITLQQATLQH